MTTHLAAPPGLLPLFVRSFAATVPGPIPRWVGLRGHRSLTVPEQTYALDGQAVDPGHLLRYEQVCGFRASDVLPPTYLHILAFPLSVKLMAAPDFPFPLPGLVHVTNSITHHRLVRSDEMCSFTVRAEDVRDHPAGRQVDLVAAVTVDGAAVWESRSTYLHRTGTTSDKTPKAVSAAEPVPATTVIRVPADIGRRYASVSGDRNPIHLHPLTARVFGFPSAIAHGMWLQARVLAALEGRLPSAYRVDVAFKTPVLLPSTVALRTTHGPDGWTVDVRSAKSGKPHLSGTVTAL